MITTQLSNKAKYRAMDFARKNNNIKCVLYAKAGTLIKEGIQLPTLLKEGSFTYLDCLITLQQLNSDKVSIVTKSFFDNVLMPQARKSVEIQERFREGGQA